MSFLKHNGSIARTEMKLAELMLYDILVQHRLTDTSTSTSWRSRRTFSHRCRYLQNTSTV